eukprot:359454-Pleurochrysis_carterae.AAC.2
MELQYMYSFIILYCNGVNEQKDITSRGIARPLEAVIPFLGCSLTAREQNMAAPQSSPPGLLAAAVRYTSAACLVPVACAPRYSCLVTGAHVVRLS